MLSPLESNLSVFNVDHVANQTRDPNATHVQGAQMMDVKKESEQMSQTVQGPEETDAWVHIGEDGKERREHAGSGGKKKKNSSKEQEQSEQAASEAPRGFSLMA